MKSHGNYCTTAIKFILVQQNYIFTNYTIQYVLCVLYFSLQNYFIPKKGIILTYVPCLISGQFPVKCEAPHKLQTVNQ